MININDNFKIGSKLHIDARCHYKTLDEIKNADINILYDGCFAYCEATKSFYVYNSANSESQTLGKWQEFSPSMAGTYEEMFTGDDTTLPTDINIQHNLNTTLVVVKTYEVRTNDAGLEILVEVFFNIIIVDENNLILRSEIGLTSDKSFKVIIQK